MSEIHKTVSHYDNHIIRVSLAAGLSTYNKPLNLALKAESGSGKTYCTIETTSFLPDEDIETLNYVSPKVFIHENGQAMVTIDGEDVPFDSIPEPVKPDPADEPDKSIYAQLCRNYNEEMKRYRELKRQVFYQIDLRNKILVFMEGIDQKLFTMLKTTMSRDNENHGYNDSKYVDEKGSVHKTRLLGSPVMIFNSVDSGEYNNEFATRCLTATPNTSQNKIKAAMEISAKKAAYPCLFNNNRFQKRLLKEYFRKIRETMKKGNISVISPYDGLNTIFNGDSTRYMRDFNKFIELIAPFAILHLYQRPVVILNDQRYLVPTIRDVLDAKDTFDKIIETTQTNADNRLIQFYWETVSKHQGDGTTLEVITDEYNQGKKRKLTSRTIYGWLEQLTKLEWVDARKGEQLTSKGYVDQQRITYHPLKNRETSLNMLIKEDLKPVLQEQFKKWLKTSLEKGWLRTPFIIPRIDGSAFEITLEELERVILDTEEKNAVISKEDFTPKSSTNQENKAENLLIPENKKIEEFMLPPNEPHPCEFYNCGLEATHYIKTKDADESYFCKTHFREMRKECESVNMKLESRQESQ
ncbi:MAG: hypothetical protein ACBZ72_04600 [Candidatus Bathyarchaeia archaeon]|jgi:hypothetical protein